MEKTYLNNFEFLRIIFTLFIVLHHIFILEQYNIFNIASASVEFFFILSGFLLLYTCEYQKSFEDFILKKVIRFFPLICFSSICMAFKSNDFSYEKIIAPLLFLPATGLFNNFTGSITIWYICVLFWVSMFYYYLIKNFNKNFVNIFLGVVTFCSYIFCVQHGWGIWRSEESLIFTDGMYRGMAGMGCGYFVALMYRKYNSISETTVCLRYSVCEILILLYITIAMFTLTAPHNRIILVIAYILLIWLFLMKKGIVSNYFDDEFIKDISKYCLSIFLTHIIVIEFLKSYVLYFDSLILQISVLFFASVLFGILVYHLFEKPIHKYLKIKILNSK